MSAIVLEAVRQRDTERFAEWATARGVAGAPRPDAAREVVWGASGVGQLTTGRPRLVLVPTGRGAVAAARAAAPAVRLTRFGRLVRTLLVAGVLALLGVGLAGQLASASGDARTVTVHAGQTLSGIAARELPDLSVADGVVELQVANSLSTSQIHAGQQLVIPAR